jgi:hypothetical protein
MIKVLSITILIKYHIFTSLIDKTIIKSILFKVFMNDTTFRILHIFEYKGSSLQNG